MTRQDETRHVVQNYKAFDAHVSQIATREEEQTRSLRYHNYFRLALVAGIILLALGLFFVLLGWGIKLARSYNVTHVVDHVNVPYTNNDGAGNNLGGTGSGYSSSTNSGGISSGKSNSNTIDNPQNAEENAVIAPYDLGGDGVVYPKENLDEIMTEDNNALTDKATQEEIEKFLQENPDMEPKILEALQEKLAEVKREKDNPNIKKNIYYIITKETNLPEWSKLHTNLDYAKADDPKTSSRRCYLVSNPVNGVSKQKILVKQTGQEAPVEQPVTKTGFDGITPQQIQGLIKECEWRKDAAKVSE